MLQYRVLIVDDDPSWQDIFRENIERLNYTEVEGKRVLKEGERYTFQFASSYEEADAKLDRLHFHLALIDLRLQEGAEELEGIKLVQKIKDLDEGTSTIIVSGYADATIATELLMEWEAFYVIEKAEDKYDPKQLTRRAEAAALQAKNRYEKMFASAMDFLSRYRDPHSWAAEVLQAILGPDRISTGRDLEHLRALLEELLVDLYPLLYHRMDKETTIDNEAGVVGTLCWSKALGQPILVRFGRRDIVDRELEDIDTGPELLVQRVFAKTERTSEVADLRGVVYVQAPLSFAEFGRSTER